MRLLPGDVISDCIAFTGFYDLDFSQTIVRMAESGGHMVDVGANLGYFSLLWAARKKSNSVTAFEASPRNFELLTNNVALNGLDTQIEIRPDAVGKENGVMEFDIGPEDQTGWGGLTTRHSDRTQRVPVVRLDSALESVNRITLLKVDIEGADTWALLGAEALLREKRIEHVWWEQNRFRMRALGIPARQAAEFLRELGYDARPQGDPDADLVDWYATCR